VPSVSSAAKTKCCVYSWSIPLRAIREIRGYFFFVSSCLSGYISLRSLRTPRLKFVSLFLFFSLFFSKFLFFSLFFAFFLIFSPFFSYLSCPNHPQFGCKKMEMKGIKPSFPPVFIYPLLCKLPILTKVFKRPLPILTLPILTFGQPLTLCYVIIGNMHKIEDAYGA